MIFAVAPNSFGDWLKSARETSLDPTTGRPYTQGRLAELMHISQAKFSQWERGDIKSLAPDDAHLLADYLGRPEAEMLQAIGYQVETLPLTDEEREMLATFRRLPPVQRELTLAQARTVAEMLRRRRPPQTASQI